MSATSVGQIGLDLVVNQKQFNKQMKGVEKIASKAGKVLAAAFAVKKVVDFGKACVNLGSDLQEVQNVVDVTFPSMTATVDKFAKKAASSFGLSEIMAKRYTGTFGAMAKAFGFSEKSAYEMGSTLTGLAGDVASFYNITQDEAYTKLKSVFTGETESLKDLGVVMTQSALDAYALSNGYGKTTKSMSEAEKVALRYAFVQNKLSAATGDFVRTSGGWANQVRILNLQFDSLKSTIGQGLINLFTPVLQVINAVIAKLGILAEAFKRFSELIAGNKSNPGAMSNLLKDANNLAKNILEVGKAAESSVRKLKGLSGIDELNNLSSNVDSSSEDNSNIELTSGPIVDAEVTTSKTIGKLDKLMSFIKDRFSPAFEMAWSKLKGPINNFKKNWTMVFRDLRTLAQPFAEYLKGPFASYLIAVFDDLGMRCAGLLDSFNKIFKDIWNIAAFPLVKKFTTEWLPLYTEFSTQFIKLSGEVFSATKRAFDMVWQEAGAPLLQNLTTMFMELVGLLQEFWHNYGEPIFQAFQTAIEKTGAIFQVLWDTFLKPVFDSLIVAIDQIWQEHLSPFMEKFLELVGELVNGAIEIYNKFIAPIVQWLAEYWGPVFATVFQQIFSYISEFIGKIVDCASGIITSLKGIIQFITGVFTGDWKKAWTGVKNIFKGIFDSLASIVKEPLNAIIGGLNGLLKGITTAVNAVVKAVNKLSFTVPDWVPGIGGKKFGFNLKEVATPQIPQLADGGFVKANTPQLAIIGDNKHQGEIVSPENKLEEMALKAAQMASKQQDNNLMEQALILLKQQNELLLGILEKEVGISESDLFNSVRKSANSYSERTGEPAFD